MDNKTGSQMSERRRFFLIYAAIFLWSIIALITGFLIEESKLLLPNVFHFEAERLLIMNKLAAHLFDEVGIAGLIACGLAVTIERFSTREFAKEARKLANEEREAIKLDVFHSILGHFVPKEIMGEMTSQILKESFLRKRLDMVYTLQPFEDLETKSMYVLVDLQMKYDIVNLSPYSRLFTVKAGISKPPIPSLFDQGKFISVSAEGCENPFTLAEEDIKLHPQSGANLSLNCSEQLRVKPGEENPTTVCIHSQTVKHFAGGSAYFSVEYHTADLELTAHVHDQTLDVDSGATPVSLDIEWLKTTEEHKPEQGIYQWKLQRPLLAFQAIYLTWNPKVLVNVDSRTPGDEVSTLPAE